MNPQPASDDICHLLTTFANSLGPDKACSGSNLFDTPMVVMKKSLQKYIFEKMKNNK